MSTSYPEQVWYFLHDAIRIFSATYHQFSLFLRLSDAHLKTIPFIIENSQNITSYLILSPPLDSMSLRNDVLSSSICSCDTDMIKILQILAKHQKDYQFDGIFTKNKKLKGIIQRADKRNETVKKPPTN